MMEFWADHDGSQFLEELYTSTHIKRDIKRQLKSRYCLVSDTEAVNYDTGEKISNIVNYDDEILGRVFRIDITNLNLFYTKQDYDFLKHIKKVKYKRKKHLGLRGAYIKNGVVSGRYTLMRFVLSMFKDGVYFNNGSLDLDVVGSRGVLILYFDDTVDNFLAKCLVMA